MSQPRRRHGVRSPMGTDLHAPPAQPLSGKGRPAAGCDIPDNHTCEKAVDFETRSRDFLRGMAGVGVELRAQLRAIVAVKFGRLGSLSAMRPGGAPQIG